MVRLTEKHALAVKLRTGGKSIIYLEKKLGVSRSTLSLWLRRVPLTASGEVILRRRKLRALLLARKKASQWHRQQKRNRLEKAAELAAETLATINLKHSATLELAVAMLYMGEGFRKGDVTGLGNSDPLVLKVFVAAMRRCFSVP